MHVADVLARKGTEVATIGPDADIAAAVAALAEHRVGALVVSADGRTIDGIISERDVVRALHASGAEVLGVAVREIMTSPVRTCAPTAEIGALARLMTEHRFRHVPVVDKDALAGIVSIGDIVKSRVDELETEHDQLIDYISSAR